MGGQEKVATQSCYAPFIFCPDQHPGYDLVGTQFWQNAKQFYFLLHTKQYSSNINFHPMSVFAIQMAYTKLCPAQTIPENSKSMALALDYILPRQDWIETIYLQPRTNLFPTLIIWICPVRSTNII